MTSRPKTIELQPEDDAFVMRKVDLGEYRSADEVVSAGIQALREREESFERMVRKEVLPVLDNLLAHPETALSADEVFGKIRARHDARITHKK